MKRFFPYVRRVVLILGALLLITGVAVALFVQTERFRELLRDQIVNTLNASVRGEVSIGGIEGSLWNNFVLHDLVVRSQGAEVLRVPRLTASYSLLALLEGRIQVIQVEGFAPILRLIQDQGGKWNLVELIPADPTVPKEPAPKEGGLDILLDTVRLHDAQIDVTLSGNKEQIYHLTETNLDARIGIVATGLEIQVRELASQILAPGLPKVQLSGALTYQGTSTPATVQISKLTLDTAQSHLRLTGQINDLKTMQAQAELNIDKLATADARQLAANWPLKQDLSGTLHVTGTPADLHSQLQVAATDARITAEGQASLNQPSPTYAGTITVAHFDLGKMLQKEGVAGVVEGTVHARGVGTSFAAVQGETRVQMHALQVGKWQVENVSLDGGVEHQVAKVTGTVRSNIGQATWKGAINFAEAQPRYDLALSVEKLDIKKVAAGEKPLSSNLNLTGTITGKGFTLAEMEAQSEVDLRPSTIGQIVVQRGRLSTRVNNGRIGISEFTLNANDTTLAVRGEVGTTAAQSGQLTYALHVGSLTPWLSLIDQQGSGSLEVKGKASGSLADLEVQGEVTTKALHTAETAIQNGTVTFAIADIGQSRPHGVITTTAQGIRSSIQLETAAVTVTLPSNQGEATPLSAQVEIKVQDIAARTYHLQGELSYQPERLTARVAQLSLESPDGTWQLSQPVSIVQDKTGIAVDHLLMVLRDQHILVDGHAALTGEQNLRVQIDRFALATLQPLLPQKPEMKGTLSVQAQVSGTAAAPRLESTLRLVDLQIAGQAYTGLNAALGYGNKSASLELTFQQDVTHALKATGTIPLSVSWSEGWQAQMLGNVDLQVRSTGLNLAFLNAFTTEAVQGVAGELSLDLVAQGPVTNLLPRGTFQLREGKATIKSMGVDIAALTVQGQVDPNQVRINQISASAGEGQLTGSGVLALSEALPQRLTFSLSADRWPVIQTRQYQIFIDGQVKSEGPLTAPRVTGQLKVPEATLRPELDFLETTPVKRDETIVVLPAKAPAELAESSGSPTETPPQPLQGNIFENLILDLTVVVPRNTWIKHHDAEVELKGEIHVTKQQRKEIVLVGTIETVRGWVGFQGRRFTLTEGQVVFAGESEINPQLHIVTQYRLPEYTVETVIDGTAKKPTLTLRSDPELEQADILALLLFGKPTNKLGEGEKLDLQKQALNITGGYVAAKIGESVSEALGLEELGIDLREVDFTGGHIGFGRYLNPDTYVAISQDIGGKKGREVSVEYSLSPEWKVTTSTSATGDNTAGIMWETRY